MKNIDKMKNSIIEQIKKMDLYEFEDFNYVMLGGECVPDGMIDTSELFDCTICRKYFRCHNDDLKEGKMESEDSNTCEENYIKYAMTEINV